MRLVHFHELIGIGKGERLDEHAIDDAEYHRVEANREREAEDRDDRDPGVATERAGSVTDVLDQHYDLDDGREGPFQCSSMRARDSWGWPDW